MKMKIMPNGEVQEFGYVHKKDYGQFDGFNGQIPDGFNIPTTDDWSDTTVSDESSFATRLELPVDTTGRMRVEGPYRKWDYNTSEITGVVRGCKINVQFRGGGSQQTTGLTQRDIKIGIASTTNLYRGLYLEYDGSADTCNIVGYSGYSNKYTYRVDMDVSEPDKFYNVTLWILRTSTGWEVAVGERDQVFSVVELADSEVDIDFTVAPFVEWVHTYATGDCYAHILSMTADYWYI